MPNCIPKKVIKQINDVYLSRYDFEGYIDTVIERLQDIKKNYPFAYIDWESDYDDQCIPVLKEERLETPDEAEARCRGELLYKEVQEKYEKQQLEKLLKKYPKNGED